MSIIKAPSVVRSIVTNHIHPVEGSQERENHVGAYTIPIVCNEHIVLDDWRITYIDAIADALWQARNSVHNFDYNLVTEHYAPTDLDPYHSDGHTLLVYIEVSNGEVEEVGLATKNAYLTHFKRSVADVKTDYYFTTRA